MNHTASTPGAKKPTYTPGFKLNSRHNSLGSLNLGNLAKASKRIGNFVAGVDQYKIHLQKDREQVKSVMISKHGFWNASFKNFLENKIKSTEIISKELEVQLTTKNCQLNDSGIYLQLLRTSQMKLPRPNGQLIRGPRLISNSFVKPKEVDKENSILNKIDPSAKPKKVFRCQDSFQNVLSTIKLKSCTQN